VDGYKIIQRSPVSGVTNFTTGYSYLLGSTLPANTMYIYSIYATKDKCENGYTIGFNTDYLKKGYESDVEVDYWIDVQELNDIQVYPNPTNDIVNITGIYEFDYELYDINGSLLKQGKNCHESIDISKQNPGLYQLRISSKDRIWSEKIIKK